MSRAHEALQHTTLPALVFDAPLGSDEPGTLDLRAFDTPVSDVQLRNDVRARWRAAPRLVIRVDDEPTPRVEALLLELVRREVRLTADLVDTFDAKHSVVVKVSAKVPPPRLARLFSIRVRATGAPLAAKPAVPAAKPAATKAPAPRAPQTTVSPAPSAKGGPNARRR